ncbi:MAG: MnhB domain-containing protein [bacterium]|jgi:multicomponent Na+:H+ antiporter subunit B
MRGMTLIVKTITRLIVGLIFLYGIYIVFHGHLTPGGGFAGGIIIAGAFILLVLAEGSEELSTEVKKWRASLFESLGIFIFWFLAMLGVFAGTFFFLNLLPKGKPLELLSAGIILPCNIGIGIEVGAALFAIFITLAVLKGKGDKE